MGPPRRRAATGLLYPIFVVAFLCAAVGVGAADPYFLKALRFIGFDQWQRLSPLEAPEADAVRIVDVDEASLARFGQWPWPRSTLADMVETLRRNGAAAIAFDVVFAEPDRTSLEQVLAGLPPEQAAALAPVVAGWTPKDQRFAAAIGAAPVVLAETLTHVEGSGAPFPGKAAFAVAGDDPLPFLRGFSGHTGNLPEFTAAATGLGAINWIPDRDQVVRRVPLLFRAGDVIAPSLAAEALRVAQGASTYVIKASNASGEEAYGQASGVNHVRIGAVDVRTDADAGIWLRYRLVRPVDLVPAWQVLAGEVPRSEIEGRIILIGTSAAGLVDLRATPLEETVPGVAIHQQIIEHLLTGQGLTRPDYAAALELTALAVLGAGLAALFPLVSAQMAAFSGLVAISALNLAAWLLFSRSGVLLDPLYPSLCVFLLGTSASFYLYRRTEVQRQEIRRAFGQYVSPAVVQQLIAQPERLSLGGEVRPLTLLFSDVRGFTKISEGLTAAELTRFINELFTPLSDVVMGHAGTIDKYIGDAIMAFWNAPLDDENHARHALQAGEAMLHKVAELNRRWGEEAKRAGRDFRPVSLGIGINTGECCVGNLGSVQRFDYSAIGDEVNVASRFESLTKQYGVPLLTGEATQSQAGDLPLLEIDLVRVKGRERPSRIFTLLSVFDIPPSRYGAVRAAHKELLDRYRAADWAGAEAALATCRGLGFHGLDALHDVYAERIADFKETPPPADWDGVFRATEK
ncbi:MAG: CHASE2 domain-containing protein [Alphaproteobacteria bacterium]|nr:CHASE2 domain-containing protein [Alphaproteobacteria bacterium]